MKRRKLLIALVIVALFFFGAYLVSFWISFHTPTTNIGVSFDPIYAEYLGLDPGETFATIVGPWQFKYVRLGIHWNQIEEQENKFDFSRFDGLVKQAETSGVKLIIALGQKTPRWPECHIPEWASNLPEEKYQAALKTYIAAVVHHYQNSPAVEMWQVENEVGLPFGICPAFTPKQLKDEISLVRNIDPAHPTITGDSGELTTWFHTAGAADYFGTTLYRTVYTPFLGYLKYFFIPPAYYRAKLALNGRPSDTAFVLELQAEPWLVDVPLADVPLADQLKLMSVKTVQENILYAKRIGLPRVYLWGAEWWYWLEKQGDRSFAEYVASLKK